VGRVNCSTCESLKEFYWLKLNQFLLAARSRSTWPSARHVAGDDELQQLKDESLDALRQLMRHAKACYGLVADEAA
jgi:hypothetical protein